MKSSFYPGCWWREISLTCFQITFDAASFMSDKPGTG